MYLIASGLAPLKLVKFFVPDINVIVGFLPEEFNNIYKEIDFINAIGSLNIEKNKGLAIKIPKEFKNELFTNYSIIFLNNQSELIISYDRLEL